MLLALYTDISPLEPPVHPFVTADTNFLDGVDDVNTAKRRRALLVSPIDPTTVGEYGHPGALVTDNGVYLGYAEMLWETGGI